MYISVVFSVVVVRYFRHSHTLQHSPCDGMLLQADAMASQRLRYRFGLLDVFTCFSASPLSL